MGIDKVTVYLSSAGSINAVNVIQALRQSSLDVRIIAGDMDPLSAGLELADKGYVMLPVNDPSFVGDLHAICAKEHVDIALPIHSVDFSVFASLKDRLDSYGIRTYAQNERSLAICSDKLRIIEWLEMAGIPHSKRFGSEMFPVPHFFPLFAKKRYGSGSDGVAKIESRLDLDHYFSSAFIAQEYLDGEEYTVDVISDLEGKMLAASPRIRLKTRDGMSVKGITVDDPEIVDYTRRIVEGLLLVGPSNVQCIRTKKGLKFYDINPRFASGGLPLAVAAGMNSPEILIRLIMGWPIPEIRIESGVSMMRYWDTIFKKKRVPITDKDQQYKDFIETCKHGSGEFNQEIHPSP